ncbi:MAG: HIT domain-containing protein [Ignavibacteriales bacterium]|nr:HIT domain-containing protein [Ignavibacteriales bacterium]
MKKLFSPWRSQYIEYFSKKKDEKDNCIFCEAYHDEDDERRFIITRGKNNFVVMNLYPYNSGHLMIVPYRHISTFNELTDDESLEIMSMIKKMISTLQAASNPDGFNIGSNLGRSAGAGIDRHIHFHIVPRWSGDTNFMPVLSDTKLISEDMKTTWRKLRSLL